jgi:hypothetical protein
MEMPDSGGISLMRVRPFLSAVLVALAVAVPPAAAEERTVVGTIGNIDLQARAFSVTDGMGTRWNFKVHPDADVDLSSYKEGDRVSVSISRATPLNMMTSADTFRKGDKIVKIPY